MFKLTKSLEKEFNINGREKDKIQMEKYMKNHFEFYGIKSPLRRKIFTQEIKKNGKPLSTEYIGLVYEQIVHNKREMNYCGVDIAIRYQKKFIKSSYLKDITSWICTRSWWDSVDPLASNVLGFYMMKFPEKMEQMVDEYTNSNNIWLQRSSIIFQLKYKEKTNEEILFDQALYFANSKEFFIQKAIGWALREYAKTNPKRVYDFIDHTSLSNLSKKEATKHRKSN